MERVVGISNAYGHNLNGNFRYSSSYFCPFLEYAQDNGLYVGGNSGSSSTYTTIYYTSQGSSSTIYMHDITSNVLTVF